MRDFTPEEKELIVNTPVTSDCFDTNEIDTEFSFYVKAEWKNLITVLERMRQMLKETNKKEIGEHFIAMLPNSYKVVKLC